MNFVTSQNGITHQIKVKPGHDGSYHYRHYYIAVCGSKIAFRSRNKGKQCKRCKHISYTQLR